MASFEIACYWMMGSEDPKHTYAVVPDAPPGAHAISGINSAAFPSDFAAIESIKQSLRGPSIRRFYELHFWNVWFSQLVSDELAKRVFDEAVNAGPRTAVKMLQESIAHVAAVDMTVDGVWGPQTLQRANSCDPDRLIETFKNIRAVHYREIVSKNPADEKYLAEWLRRAQQ